MSNEKLGFKQTFRKCSNAVEDVVSMLKQIDLSFAVKPLQHFLGP